MTEHPTSGPHALIQSFHDFISRDFKGNDPIGFNLQRHEIGLIASVTNVGKSTLLRNALLSLATGKEFKPLIELKQPRRVLLLDFETSAARLQADLICMTKPWPNEEQQLLNEHFSVMCEATVNGEMLSLSQHLGAIEMEARLRKADLIVVDTAAAAFDLYDENSNSEVTRRVLKPLLKLARNLDCAIVVAHHIGKSKSEEGGMIHDKVHRPRGASAFSGYAASIFLLTNDANDPNTVTLSCVKRKSGPSYDIKLKICREARWFRPLGDVQRTLTNYELVVESIYRLGGSARRADIHAALTGKLASQTISRHLKEALSRGALVKKSHGVYSVPANTQVLPN